MSHKASNSLDLTTLSLSSLSSVASVELYEETLKPKIDTIRYSSATLQGLVDSAMKIVNEKFAPEDMRTHTYNEVSVRLDKVMIAMLTFAEECGGESGKRYVAAAICSCPETNDVVGALVALGTTWLTHFLFIFKSSRGHTNQPDKTPSEIAAPTSNQTATQLLEPVGNRKLSFTDDVKRRDGYECILTGYQDDAHPNAPGDDEMVTTGLITAHILRRVIGSFDDNRSSTSYKSAVTTFDMLLNFTCLPIETLDQLSIALDHPSNGITLEINAHNAFDRLGWCLKKTEVPNVYDLKIFKKSGILKKPESGRITFRDRSNDFSSPTGSLKRKAPVDLPNPHYIAIHSAIAGILDMSGAGKFFDEILDNHERDGVDISPVRCWPEMEKLMEGQLFRDAFTESLHLTSVH